MFDGDVASQHEGYQEAFDFRNIDTIKHKQPSNDKWPEVELKPSTPKLKGPGITVEEKKLKIIVVNNGEKKVWPKTPAVVRQLREYKRSNP